MAFSQALYAQTVNFEGMVGDKNYFYQHAIGVKLNGTGKLMFTHSASLHAMYDDKEKNELMSQSYLTYPLNKWLRIAAGTFYATKPGINPALALNFRYVAKDFILLFNPRIDAKSKGSFEGMLFSEYMPRINNHLLLYTRFQLMSNYTGSKHNRSYQNFRIGLTKDNLSFGLALNIDQRGGEMQTQHNLGFFAKHQF